MPTRIAKTAGAGPRVIAVFGPPGVGVSTLLDVLTSASESHSVVIPYTGPESIPVVKSATQLAHVVFLDVDGGCLSVQDIQDLVDNRIIFQDSGAIIRVHASTEEVMARVASRVDYVKEDDIKDWSRSLLPVEEHIRKHNIGYFMISNSDLVDGVRQLALRANLRK